MDSLTGLTVAVLMGGPSEEHEISLRSGQGVVEALRRRHARAEPLVIPKALSIREAVVFVEEALQAQYPDVAFIALHGAFGEDGTIQTLCERLQVAYTGSDAAASRLGMDKVASRRRFQDAGLSVPRWHLLDRADRRPPALSGWSYPLVVKPTNQGSSLGVSLVPARAGLGRAIGLAGRYDSRILIEECVAGRELTVGVLGEEPLPVVEIRPHQPFFDYTAKYTAGRTEYLVPAALAPAIAARVQAAGLSAHRALGCRHLSRTDLILTRREEPVILEVNTIPGFTPTSLLPKAAAAAGCAYDEVCERLVMMAWAGSAHLAGSVDEP
jgi:D-alanine--D-alanine ligase